MSKETNERNARKAIAISKRNKAQRQVHAETQEIIDRVGMRGAVKNPVPSPKQKLGRKRKPVETQQPPGRMVGADRKDLVPPRGLGRCEPPAIWSNPDGHHWLRHAESGTLIVAWWNADDRLWAWLRDVNTPTPEEAYRGGWDWVAPALPPVLP